MDNIYKTRQQVIAMDPKIQVGLIFKKTKSLHGTHICEAKNKEVGASQVAQWLRICLLMQGTRVQALVWEDPTCRGATRPVSHNY